MAGGLMSYDASPASCQSGIYAAVPYSMHRWARGQYELLPKLAAELAALHPAVIAAHGGAPSGRAAKAATSAIPVFFVAADAVNEGLVASLSRPGGNVTGVDIMSSELTGKRLGLLAQLIPAGGAIAFLMH